MKYLINIDGDYVYKGRGKNLFMVGAKDKDQAKRFTTVGACIKYMANKNCSYKVEIVGQ